MPGGSKFRQWYAMRKAMQERGTWRGREGERPTHPVPALEEGEPPAQRARTEGADSVSGSSASPAAASSPATPESLPELEKSPTAEGEYGERLYNPAMGASGYSTA
nr:hypothetical protein [Chaphamaparvovirus sp.]